MLINVAHPSIGSRMAGDHLPPLGMLAIGGPLLDDGHMVRLVDADRTNMKLEGILCEIAEFRPDAVLMGHSGSTSAHPIIAETAGVIAALYPKISIIYGGVYPTYHWREILTEEPYVKAIIRGEGEETTRRFIRALENDESFDTIPGLAFMSDGKPKITQPAPLIRNLDDYRIAWELIDHSRYSYWGGMRAVAVQFSRGCPHLCSYCGQRGFWTRWRHRDPVLFAKELARLHREHGVKVINFADENPTVSKKAWKTFLEALIAENVDLLLVGSTRADDIVRDADILHLYRKAGIVRFLLGLENTDEKTLQLIRKGSLATTDRKAIQLLREHNIISMGTWVVGFDEETDRSFIQGIKTLLSYDPDQIQIMYVTPHSWTPFFNDADGRRIVQNDQKKWDYKHQILETKNMPSWRLLFWVKFTEMVLQCRPKALYRTFLHPDREIRHAMRWYSSIGRRVWPYEIFRFLLDKKSRKGRFLRDFWEPRSLNEEAMDGKAFWPVQEIPGEKFLSRQAAE